jgi:uncharacterized protein YgiM (DUF1202 family)
MLRMVLLLCAAMIGALLILGEDRGQLRPGLAEAALNPPVEVAAPVEDAEAPIVAAAALEQAALPPAAPAAAEPEPYVEPAREVVQAVEEPVFTLSSLGNELVPGEDGTAVAPVDEPVETAEETTVDTSRIWYVTANSVNVRAEPSTEGEVLGKLASGEAALLIAAVDGEWGRIVIQGDGMEGYVALRYLSPQAP